MDAAPSTPKMTLSGSTTPSSLAAPASKHYTSPSELIPRSKVRALMTAIEEDSESDPPARSSSSRIRSIDGSLLANIRRSGSESTGSAGDDPLRKAPAPRGKLAARLQGNHDPSVGSFQTDKSNEGDAYTRMKKKLAPADSPSKGSFLNSAQSSPDTGEDQIMGMARKRRRRASQVLFAEPESAPTTMQSSRPPSPGLFITPEKERASKRPTNLLSEEDISQRNSSDSDLSPNPQAKSQLFALVARKREQRLAKEAETKRKAHDRELAIEESKRQKNDLRIPQITDDESDGSDIEKLTQHVRPTRKASKRAEEENKREIQRMSRNMQLAHQARTKKKITKESLFARFNFRTGPSPASASNLVSSSSAAASSDVASDVDIVANAESPPTSPMTPGDESQKNVQWKPETTTKVNTKPEEPPTFVEGVLPDLQDVVNMSQERLDKGKVRAVHDSEINNNNLVDEGTIIRGNTVTKKPIHVRLQKPTVKPQLGEDSDSDLEILPIKANTRKVDEVFARLPTARGNEGHSLQTLRALAHLTSPNKQTTGTKPSLSLSDMQNSLQKRARQQAARERAEKIQDLKDRGVIIQTAEERQKDQAEVEDLLEKARREAVDLKQKEKDKAKKEARANGEVISDDTSEDDEDYQENDADESNIELSGSEEEGENEVDAAGNSTEEDDSGHEDKGEDDSASLEKEALIVEQASEVSEDDDEEVAPTEEAEQSDEEDERLDQVFIRRRHKNVIDDEDEDDNENCEETKEDNSGKVPHTQVATQYPSNLGLPTFAGAPMGMTQAFAATMADSQTQEDGHPATVNQEEDSLAFLGPPPEPELPDLDMQNSPQMIVDSQGVNATDLDLQPDISLHLSQYEAPMESLRDSVTGPSATQLSDIPDPTQDVGFALSSPVAGRYVTVPPSTVDTIILPNADEPESLNYKRKGRLRRKIDVVLPDVVAADAEQEQQGMLMSANAFDVLKKGPKKSDGIQKFDKKKSNAQEMVEEQAQESEDEYAGLGGASDDESHGEEDEEVKKMIEQGNVDVDERQLAAFYADKERASDEKAVEKLFKDINNGMLRRKRGADFDLSDSDDDVEARRRRKRKEFAKMRKALLENENVGKIAEDPKKIAFLRAIEDREEDEDLDFLEQAEESSQPAMEVESQQVSEPPAEGRVEEPATAAAGKRKRPLTESAPDTTNRPPPAARRTAAMKKPLSLAEIRASVSFLIEEPDAVSIIPPSSSPVASDNENDENIGNNEHVSMGPPPDKPTDNKKTNPFASRRRPNPVIDRLSLRRESSSSASASASASSSLLAFHNPSASINPTFKVPSLLLRRATTSSSSNNNSQDAHGISTLAETERSAGGAEKGDFVRRGGTKRISVNFAARRVVRDVEEGMKEGLRRMVRREGSSLSGLGGGSFE
ncbi:MAG: hypothetical protein Q9213_008404 [Squamulea squamosa]